MAFADLVADELTVLRLTKTAAELSDVEEDTPDETVKKRRRALLGAGLTAAALGGVGYAFSKGMGPAQEAGRALATAVSPPVTPPTAREVVSATTDWLGKQTLSPAFGLAAGLTAAKNIRLPGHTGIQKQIVQGLREDDDTFARRSSWRGLKEFARGLNPFAAPLEHESIAAMREALDQYGGSDNDIRNRRKAFAAALERAVAGRAPSGQLNLTHVDDILNRLPAALVPPGTAGNRPGTTATTYADALAAAVAQGARPGAALRTLRNDVLTHGGVDVATTPAIVTNPRERRMNLANLDSTIRQLIDTYRTGESESAGPRQRFLAGGGAASAEDMRAVVRSEIAGRLLASIGTNMGLAPERQQNEPPQAHIDRTAQRTAEVLDTLRRAAVEPAASVRTPGRMPISASLPRVAPTLGTAAIAYLTAGSLNLAGSPSEQAAAPTPTLTATPPAKP